MIDKICEYLTNKIKCKMPEFTNERLEIINYGIHLIVGEIPKTFVFIIIAMLLGVLKEFFITILVIFPYRMVSGGFHLKTHFGCIFATSLMYCGTAFLGKILVIPEISKKVLIILVWLISIIFCKLYAPADTENVPILRKKDRKIKKILSYIVVTIILVIGFFIQNNIISNIILLGISMQSFSITRIAYNITNNKYGYEVYEQNKEILNS